MGPHQDGVSALERLAPPALNAKVPAGGDAFVWEPAQGGLIAVAHVASIDLVLLKGIESQRETLMANTARFAQGLPANNALLWGARGMGKSALLRASINVILYATSNRRHLLAREMIENERSTAINPGEAVEEKVSLSDRFGLWLGFHNCNQDDYLAMVEGYAAHYKLKLGKEELRKQALSWAIGRGNRSGRVAWQFIQDLAGELAETEKR